MGGKQGCVCRAGSGGGATSLVCQDGVCPLLCMQGQITLSKERACVRGAGADMRKHAPCQHAAMAPAAAATACKARRTCARAQTHTHTCNHAPWHC